MPIFGRQRNGDSLHDPVQVLMRGLYGLWPHVVIPSAPKQPLLLSQFPRGGFYLLESLVQRAGFCQIHLLEQ
jgi:hypothetical protein